jgi:hypothetical protein
MSPLEEPDEFPAKGETGAKYLYPNQLLVRT